MSPWMNLSEETVGSNKGWARKVAAAFVGNATLC